MFLTQLAIKRHFKFLRATAGTAIARLSHRNSVRPSVCPSVRHTGGSGKNGASRDHQIFTIAAPKTLVSGSVTLFQKFHRGHPNRGP